MRGEGGYYEKRGTKGAGNEGREEGGLICEIDKCLEGKERMRGKESVCIIAQNGNIWRNLNPLFLEHNALKLTPRKDGNRRVTDCILCIARNR